MKTKRFLVLFGALLAVAGLTAAWTPILVKPPVLLTPVNCGPKVPSRAYDAATISWQSAVGAANIDYGALQNVDQFVFNLKQAGVFALLDDFGFLTVANAAQTKSFLKHRTLNLVNGATVVTGTAGGGGTPGLVTDGVSQYGDTQYVPSVDSVAASAANFGLSVVELANLGANNIAFGVSDSASVNAYLQPRPTASTVGARVNSNILSGTLAVQTSVGLTHGQRDSSTTAEVYKNGASVSVTAPTTNGVALAAHSLFVGGLSNIGVASNFRASTYGFWSFGASMNATQAAAFYTAVKAYFTYYGVALP